MSGLEVAGIILGAVPLLISALEHYTQGLDLMENMAKHRQIFNEIYVTFVACASIFTYDCEDLFCQRLSLSDEQYQTIIDDPSRKWDETVVAKLQNTLGQSACRTYRELLEVLARKFRKLQSKLELSKEGAVPFIEDGVIDEKKFRDLFHRWKRIKKLSVASRAEKYKKLVAEIEADINRIHDLTTKAVASELRRQQHVLQNRLPQYCLKVQNHTAALFQNLVESWPESCAATHTHHADLLIDVPVKNEQKEDIPEFRLHFNTRSHEKHEVSPWGHRSATLLVNRPLTQNNGLTEKVKAPVAPVVDHGPSSCEACPLKDRIADFCTALSGAQGPCLGILACGGHSYHVHDVEEHQRYRLFPLQVLIEKREIIWRRKRCGLSLALAYAVLQLYETPWLRQKWTLEDILFDESHSSYQIWIGQVLSAPSEHVAGLENPGHQIFYGPSILKNETLFSLGVALIELACSRPLISFLKEEDLDEHGAWHVLTRYRIANRLSEKLFQEDGPKFASAVSKCIHPRSDNHNFDLNHEAFRKCYVEDVFTPLLDDYYELFGKPF